MGYRICLALEGDKILLHGDICLKISTEFTLLYLRFKTFLAPYPLARRIARPEIQAESCNILP